MMADGASKQMREKLARQYVGVTREKRRALWDVMRNVDWIEERGYSNDPTASRVAFTSTSNWDSCWMDSWIHGFFEFLMCNPDPHKTIRFTPGGPGR